MKQSKDHTNWNELRAEFATEDPAFEDKTREASLRLDLAQLVYDLRTTAGITQTELARRMRTRQSAIARLEGGAMNPTAALLARLGHALGVQLTLIVGETRQEHPAQVVISESGAKAS